MSKKDANNQRMWERYLAKQGYPANWTREDVSAYRGTGFYRAQSKPVASYVIPDSKALDALASKLRPWLLS